MVLRNPSLSAASEAAGQSHTQGRKPPPSEATPASQSAKHMQNPATNPPANSTPKAPANPIRPLGNTAPAHPSPSLKFGKYQNYEEFLVDPDKPKHVAPRYDPRFDAPGVECASTLNFKMSEAAAIHCSKFKIINSISKYLYNLLISLITLEN
jgi:hypothetical protein